MFLSGCQLPLKISWFVWHPYHTRSLYYQGGAGLEDVWWLHSSVRPLVWLSWIFVHFIYNLYFVLSGGSNSGTLDLVVVHASGSYLDWLFVWHCRSSTWSPGWMLWDQTLLLASLYYFCFAFASSLCCLSWGSSASSCFSSSLAWYLWPKSHDSFSW